MADNSEPSAGNILPYSSDSDSPGDAVQPDKGKGEEKTRRHSHSGNHHHHHGHGDSHRHSHDRHSHKHKDRDGHSKSSRRRSRSRSPSYRYRHTSSRYRRRSRSRSYSPDRRDRRRRSRSPPRRGSGRGRGPVTPTVGEIPPQPKAMVRDSFTAPVTSPATQFNVSDNTALEWLRSTVAAGVTGSVGTAVITNLTPEERVAAAKAAAEKVSAKLPTPLPSQPTVDPKAQAIEEKRKLLWNKKKEENTSAGGSGQWDIAAFTGDDGGTTQAKFRRLMGIQDGDKPAPEVKPPANTSQEHERTLEDLERQYEMSRYQTHMGRGLGLGFTSVPTTQPKDT